MPVWQFKKLISFYTSGNLPPRTLHMYCYHKSNRSALWRKVNTWNTLAFKRKVDHSMKLFFDMHQHNFKSSSHQTFSQFLIAPLQFCLKVNKEAYNISLTNSNNGQKQASLVLFLRKTGAFLNAFYAFMSEIWGAAKEAIAVFLHNYIAFR